MFFLLYSSISNNFLWNLWNIIFQQFPNIHENFIKLHALFHKLDHLTSRKLKLWCPSITHYIAWSQNFIACMSNGPSSVLPVGPYIRVFVTWIENSVCKISWQLVKNWLRNPRNSFTMVDEFNVNLIIILVFYCIPSGLNTGFKHSIYFC